jgi:hypothetical protein
MATHKAIPLSVDVDREIENILDRTRKYFSEKNLL